MGAKYLQFTCGLLLWFILLGTVALYWHGLNGVYLLDDYANLDKLEKIKYFPEDWLDTPEARLQVGQFFTGGHAGVLGRPISLLSFAMQAHRWLTSVEDFRYVNLMIHLLNGCLVFWLIFYLTHRFLKLPEHHSLALALVTSTAWLASPIQVSTVLYIIQRMVQLSALFTLVGLLTYLHGRAQLLRGNLIGGYAWVSLGMGACGMLAVLSKENGALLLLYVLVLETTLLRVGGYPRYWRLWRSLFLYIPTVLFLGYLIAKIPDFLEGYSLREFTLGERLLTEARILLEYVSKIFIPRLSDLGLFHDDYVVSRGIFEPFTTLPALLLVLSTFVSGILLRARYPVMAFGILWFFAGHFLESTFIPLLLYFDHRNYLAMLGPLFAAIYGVSRIFISAQKPVLRGMMLAAAIAWGGLASFATYSESKLWGNPVLQAEVWAQESPLSRFAQSNALSIFHRLGQVEKAFAYTKHMVDTFPQDAGPYILWVRLYCDYPDIPAPDTGDMLQRLRTTEGDFGLYNSLMNVIDRYLSGKCRDLSEETLNSLLRAIASNPRLHDYFRPFVYDAYAYFLENSGHYEEAIKFSERALLLEKDDWNMKMQHLAFLIRADRIQDALDYIKALKGEMTVISERLYLDDLKRVETNLRKLQKSKTRAVQVPHEQESTMQ